VQNDVGFIECDRQAETGEPSTHLEFEEKVLGLFVLSRQAVEALFQLHYAFARARNALRKRHGLGDADGLLVQWKRDPCAGGIPSPRSVWLRGIRRKGAQPFQFRNHPTDVRGRMDGDVTLAERTSQNNGPLCALRRSHLCVLHVRRHLSIF